MAGCVRHRVIEACRTLRISYCTLLGIQRSKARESCKLTAPFHNIQPSRSFNWTAGDAPVLPLLRNLCIDMMHVVFNFSMWTFLNCLFIYLKFFIIFIQYCCLIVIFKYVNLPPNSWLTVHNFWWVILGLSQWTIIAILAQIAVISHQPANHPYIMLLLMLN